MYPIGAWLPRNIRDKGTMNVEVIAEYTAQKAPSEMDNFSVVSKVS